MSTETLRIEKLTSRYHLPASRFGERARLDRLLTRILDHHLAPALAMAQIQPKTTPNQGARSRAPAETFPSTSSVFTSGLLASVGREWTTRTGREKTGASRLTGGA